MSPHPEAGFRPSGATRLRLGALLVVLLAGCGGGTGGKAAVSVQHPWIHPPTANDPKAIVLPPFLVYRVA